MLLGRRRVRVVLVLVVFMCRFVGWVNDPWLISRSHVLIRRIPSLKRSSRPEPWAPSAALRLPPRTNRAAVLMIGDESELLTRAAAPGSLQVRFWKTSENASASFNRSFLLLLHFKREADVFSFLPKRCISGCDVSPVRQSLQLKPDQRNRTDQHSTCRFWFWLHPIHFQLQNNKYAAEHEGINRLWHKYKQVFVF